MMIRLTHIALALALVSCRNDTKRQTDMAADHVLHKQQELRYEENVEARRRPVDKKATEVSEANAAFEAKRLVRIQTLRAVHAVAAAQPNMINTLGRALPLTEIGREAVKEKLEVLQLRLDESKNMIEGLRHVDAGLWKDRDDQVSNAMSRLDDARKDAWKVIEDAPRTDRSAY